MNKTEWLEKLMALADEYAQNAACEVEGFDPASDHDDTQNARAALLAHAEVLPSIAA
ncbi:MAG: hypothetical protein AB7E32_10710 [Desulfovibrio sp.]